MASTAFRRLMRDFKKFEEETPEGINATPTAENLMEWEAVIIGPEETIWEGGIFKLKMVFSEEYPNKAPDVRFVNKMFHPNIYNDGTICIDILSSPLVANLRRVGHSDLSAVAVVRPKSEFAGERDRSQALCGQPERVQPQSQGGVEDSWEEGDNEAEGADNEDEDMDAEEEKKEEGD
eukprot:CAMPEP_0168345182 /NCGR_PEP_ID=MMETSP0213-20121227/17382_1 /TAXON_ID=151035 /ORGANISM="Euplotes harpa, Strain FSP1.4" /LENGTH=177 /DNA_ID=CAMNT_0008353311 /DNA_START=13 /DNA_END=546 /DNA_ORIENTATION=-